MQSSLSNIDTMVTASKHLVIGIIIMLRVKQSMTSYVSVSCEKNCQIKNGVLSGDKMDNIDLKFSINSTGFGLFQILYDKDFVVTLTPEGKLKRITTAPSFIQVSNTSTKTSIGYDFTFQLLNLNLSMQGSELSYVLTLGDWATRITAKWDVDILYGPELLSGLNSTYNVTETHDIGLRIRMWGKPQPSLSVRFSNTENQVNSTGGKGLYDYYVAIKDVRRHHCGETLSISYQDHKNVTFQQNATVFVIFNPEVPTIIAHKVGKASKCLSIQWKMIESGHCPVTYILNCTSYNDSKTNQELVYISPSTNSTLLLTKCFRKTISGVSLSVQAWVNGQGGRFSVPRNIQFNHVSKGLGGGATAGIVIVVLLIAVVAVV